MNERRGLERFKLNIPVRVTVSLSEKKKEMLEAHTKNICAGGAYCRTDHSIHKGAKVQLDFVLPAKKFIDMMGVTGFIKIAGTVVRSEDIGVAICFDNRYELMPYKAT